MILLAEKNGIDQVQSQKPLSTCTNAAQRRKARESFSCTVSTAANWNSESSSLQTKYKFPTAICSLAPMFMQSGREIETKNRSSLCIFFFIFIAVDFSFEFKKCEAKKWTQKRKNLIKFRNGWCFISNERRVYYSGGISEKCSRFT